MGIITQSMFQFAGKMVGGLISIIFSLFADLDISAAEKAITGIIKYIRAACYFLPMPAITSIFSVVLGLWSLKIIIKTLKTIWEITPFL